MPTARAVIDSNYHIWTFRLIFCAKILWQMFMVQMAQPFLVLKNGIILLSDKVSLSNLLMCAIWKKAVNSYKNYGIDTMVLCLIIMSLKLYRNTFINKNCKKMFAEVSKAVVRIKGTIILFFSSCNRQQLILWLFIRIDAV